MMLIGVVYAGFEYDVQENIFKSNPVDQLLNLADNGRSIISKIPMSIASVIKSTRIMDFEPILKDSSQQ